jgi:dynein intermediate chain
VQSNKLIYSFEEASDYVYDVQWSPTHPAVFASVDGQSRLCVWNLNEDTEACTGLSFSSVISDVWLI